MRLMRWLLKISLTAVLVSTLTILTTGLVVNAYIQTLLASFNIQLENQPGLGGMMRSMFGFSGSQTVPSKEDEAEAVITEDNGEKGTEDHHNVEPESNPAEPSSGESKGAPDNSIPVMGQGLSGEIESQEGQQIVMTPDEMVDKKSSLTLEEKEEIFTLLMAKLPQSEMQKISSAMENGLTAAELAEIEKGISEYLSEDEFNKLMSMLQS